MMDDTISRQAAIDAGLRLCGMDTKMELINLCEASIADSEGRAGAILDYIGELEDLPSAQPEREHTMEEFMYGQDMGNPEDGSL